MAQVSNRQDLPRPALQTAKRHEKVLEPEAGNFGIHHQWQRFLSRKCAMNSWTSQNAGPSLVGPLYQVMTLPIHCCHVENEAAPQRRKAGVNALVDSEDHVNQRHPPDCTTSKICLTEAWTAGCTCTLQTSSRPIRPPPAPLNHPLAPKVWASTRAHTLFRSAEPLQTPSSVKCRPMKRVDFSST